jgi:hypothetical protein
MERYGQPVSLNPIPREHVERELLPFQLEAIARAKADAAARRNGPPSEGESHGS